MGVVMLSPERLGAALELVPLFITALIGVAIFWGS
jgi:hypothetical protein